MQGDKHRLAQGANILSRVGAWVGVPTPSQVEFCRRPFPVKGKGAFSDPKFVAPVFEATEGRKVFDPLGASVHVFVDIRGRENCPQFSQKVFDTTLTEKHGFIPVGKSFE